MSVTPFPSTSIAGAAGSASGNEEFEFSIGFQSLKGLQNDGVYGVAWRKGAETGRTPTVTSVGGEVDINTEVSVTEVRNRKPKQLFEVYVNKYQGQAKETIGMLYMDLAMHIPKNGKLTNSQSAFLQLSNCLCETTRLSLTVQCSVKKQATSQNAAKPQTAPTDSQLIKELRDEIACLTIQNQRLQKNEEAYTYSNQPVRQNTRTLETEIETLKNKLVETERMKNEELIKERNRMESATDELREMVKRLKVQHVQEISEYKVKLDEASKAVNDHEMSLAKNNKLAETVQLSQETATTQSRQLTSLQQQLALSQQQIDILRQKLLDKDNLESRLQIALDEKGAECASLATRNDGLESQRVSLTRRVAQLENEYRELFAQSSDEKSATDDAKTMLTELMNKMKQAQTVETTLQSALSIAEEEKKALMEEVTELKRVVQDLQQGMETIRFEENAASHSIETSLRTELDAERAAGIQLTNKVAFAEAELARSKSEKEAVEVKMKIQDTKLTQRKRRITDLKRILGLHLKLKQAQMTTCDISLTDAPLIGMP